MSTEHVSFLRLERLRLHELSEREARVVSEHLAGCTLCGECYAEVERELTLPALPATPVVAATSIERARRRRWLTLSAGATGALALAAAALLVLRPGANRDNGEVVPLSRIGIKGGDVAIELVRKHRGALAGDSSVFAEGDAFKVLLTCPPPLTPRFEVVVYQAGLAYFPLPAGALSHCGNRRELTGAFSLDGADDALVCVALDGQRVPARAALSRGPAALPELSVCTRVRPAR